MSDIEADNTGNVSLQREHPEEETESIPNEAEADDNTVPELDIEALHGSLVRRNPNVKLKGAKLEWLETEISDKIEIDAALKKWQAVSGPAQADVKTQSKRKKRSVLDTKKQEEVKTKSGDDVDPSTAPEGDSIGMAPVDPGACMTHVPPAGMHTVMVNKAQANAVLSQFERNSESSEMTELVGVICNILSLD